MNQSAQILPEDVQQYLADDNIQILVAFSGGKDSVAMVLHLLFDLCIDPSRIELHHHEVDGGQENFMDWECTPSYCQSFADHFGLQLFFSYRQGGIKREIMRTNEGLQPVMYQQEVGGAMHKLESKPGNTTRHMWPEVSANMQKRWCSWTVKISVLERVLRNHPRSKFGGKYLVCTGERRQESGNRACYKNQEKHKTWSRSRNVIHWRPVLEWSEADVWDLMKAHRIQCHPAYELGWSRCSCKCCIFNSPNVWATLNQLQPSALDEIKAVSDTAEHTLYNGTTIHEKAASGRSFLSSIKEKQWKDQAFGTFTAPIAVQGDWQLPQGAFSVNKSGSV